MRLAVLLPALLLPLALTACGGDDDDDGDAAAPPTQQVCPGSLTVQTEVTSDDRSGAPIAVDGGVVVLTDGQPTLVSDDGTSTAIGEPLEDPELVGPVDDDILLADSTSAGFVVMRMTLDGEQVWESTQDSTGADLDALAGVVKVDKIGEDDVFLDAADGSDAEDPDAGNSLGDITLQEEDEALVLLERSDVRGLFGELDPAGSTRYVVTDDAKEDRWEIARDEGFQAHLCGTRLFALGEARGTLDVYDTTQAEGADPVEQVSLDSPAQAEAGFTLGEAYVSIRVDDASWLVLRP